jgi:hypothetical protein
MILIANVTQRGAVGKVHLMQNRRQVKTPSLPVRDGLETSLDMKLIDMCTEALTNGTPVRQEVSIRNRHAPWHEGAETLSSSTGEGEVDGVIRKTLALGARGSPAVG